MSFDSSNQGRCQITIVKLKIVGLQLALSVEIPQCGVPFLL